MTDEEPDWTGTITVDGEPMKFWLPDWVDPDELGIDWVGM